MTDIDSQNEDESVTDMKKYPWTSYHTFTIICLRLCGDLMMGVTLMFDYELSHESLTTLQIFSSVNVCRYLGIFLSIFWSPLNMKYFKNNNKIITLTYAILSSLFTVCFGLTYFIKYLPNESTETQSQIMIALQCILWLFYGLSFSIYNSGTIAIVTQYSDPSTHGKMISLISLSWSLSSLFYPICAYLMDIHASLPFLVFGLLLLLFSILVSVTYNFEIPTVNTNEESDANQSVNITQVLHIMKDEYYSLLYLITFIISIASGANITVLGSPLLSDLYGLSVSYVGWSLLAIFLGEFTSNLYMIKCVETQGFYKTAALGLILKILSGISIILTAKYYISESALSLLLTLCMMFIVFFAWEAVFVSQLTAVNNAVDLNEQCMNNKNSANSRKRLVFVIHCAVIAVAKPIGIVFASTVWNDGKGLIYIGLLLICTSVLASLCYYFYYQKRNPKVIGHTETTPLL